MTLAWCVAAASAVLAAVLARRLRQRPTGAGAEPPAALWEALGGDPLPGAESWASALALAEELRQAARRTRRLQLEAADKQREFDIMSEVLAVMSDGIVVLDASEQVLYANATALRVLELDLAADPTLGGARGRPDMVDALRSILRADLARGVKRLKLQWQDGDQQRCFVLRCLPFDGARSGGSRKAFVILMKDNTAEEKASRAKTEFVYGISHELKTPLTSIQASLEMLVDEPRLGDEERDKLTRLSLAETMRLDRMVRELLDLARVEAGITEFKLEKVPIGEILVELRALHAPIADREAIALHWNVSDYLPTVRGDAGLLRQAFVNIVGNAVKYTKRGGEVTLFAGIEGEELVVRIRDTGIGIAAEDLPKIFDKFFRAGSAHQSRIAGTGLGLPLARYIIERHNGRIEVTSEIGTGTEFTVFLPALSTDADRGRAESALVAVDGVLE